MSSPALITPLPVNRGPNKLAPNVPNNFPRNPIFCYFASLLIILLTSFINKPDSLKDSFISSYEIVSAVVSDPKKFF